MSKFKVEAFKRNVIGPLLMAAAVVLAVQAVRAAPGTKDTREESPAITSVPAPVINKAVLYGTSPDSLALEKYMFNASSLGLVLKEPPVLFIDGPLPEPASANMPSDRTKRLSPLFSSGWVKAFRGAPGARVVVTVALTNGSPEMPLVVREYLPGAVLFAKGQPGPRSWSVPDADLVAVTNDDVIVLRGDFLVIVSGDEVPFEQLLAIAARHAQEISPWSKSRPSLSVGEPPTLSARSLGTAVPEFLPSYPSRDKTYRVDGISCIGFDETWKMLSCVS